MVDDKKDLEDIKKLLMLLLIKFGATSEEISYALKLESSVVRKMLPISKIKKINGFENKKTPDKISQKTKGDENNE